MKIIIAEDNKVSAKLLEKLLSKAGHEIICADNGRSAWEKLNETGARILVSDWMMPELSGIELCQKIRSSDFPGYIYIILLSAKNERKDALEGLMAGADDYMMKPFDPEELKVRIRTAERIINLEDRFEKTQKQLLISEKMASIGQLAAGVAHEINNPVGFISSNLKTLSDYFADVVNLINSYREIISNFNDEKPESDALKKIYALEQKIDLEYILKDIEDLIGDCCEGTERIKHIVIDMKDFAHPGENKPAVTDVNRCIESTLHMVWNELKYKASVHSDLGEIPDIECIAQQISQVIMNLLVNAAHAIPAKGDINIKTAPRQNGVEIRIKDTGTGIPPDKIEKIFDPFFTTKEPGKGTGLGLHVAYNIIKKHGGSIDVKSSLGQGTEFILWLPEKMPT